MYLKPVISASLLLLLPVASALAQNKVQNSSFEDGSSPWFSYPSGPASGSANVVTSSAHWESSSMEVKATVPPYSGFYALQQDVPGFITDGRKYYVYFWCKGESVGGSTELIINNNWGTVKTLPSGTYNWTLVEHEFVPDASTVPFRIILKNNTGSLFVDDVYITDNKMVRANNIGIVGDGGDRTNQIITALEQHKFLYLPAGTYEVRGPITLPVGAMVWGEGTGTNIRFYDNPYAFGVFEAFGSVSAYAGNNEISGIRFSGYGRQFAVRATRAKNITVRSCIAETLGLFESLNFKDSYDLIQGEADLSSNIKIVGNKLYPIAPSVNTSGDGVVLRYVTDTLVYGNDINGHRHGIYFWGGDADFDRGGFPNNPRWARRILIKRNIVKNITMGGIWGSMGLNVTIDENTVTDCDDVCIDLEGCVDSSANWNYAKNGKNGTLATYYAVSNVTFANNTVENSDVARPLYRLQNSSAQAVYVQNLRFVNNKFRFTGTNGIGFLDTYWGPGKLIFTGNEFSNVKIDISPKDNPHFPAGVAPVISGNFFTFSNVSVGCDVIYLKWAEGSPTITNNTILYSGSAGGSTTGLKLLKVGGPTSYADIKNNIIRGCALNDMHIYYAETGLNATITGNTVQYSRIKVGKQGKIAVTASGNKNLSNQNVNVQYVP